MKNLLIIIFLTLILFGSAMDKATICQEQILDVTGRVTMQQVGELWQKVNPKLYQWSEGTGYISDGLKRSHPYELYDIQLHTSNLLRYSIRDKDLATFESLLRLYSDVFQTLKESNQYKFYYYPGFPRQSIQPLDKPYEMWLNADGAEIILCSSQFLYAVSEALVFICSLDPSTRSSLMTEFAVQSINILKSHYSRWCFAQAGPFQVRGWGCKFGGRYVEGGLNHADFLRKKRQGELGDETSPSYCNAVTDVDLWIVTGLANFLSAAHLDTSLVAMDDELRNLYNDYMVDGLELVRQRLTFTDLQDFSRNKVRGVIFDSGAWDDSRDYKYLQYSGYPYPAKFILDQISPPLETSWDISHSRRYVDVFISLVRNSEILGLSFPKESLLKYFANQFVYKVFNGNFRYPLFSNFWNGDNGWYRVGYSKRQGYGYAPNDLSVASLTGGYAWFSPYNKDLELLYSRLYTMILCGSKLEKEWLADHFSGNRYKNYRRFKPQDLMGQTAIIDDLLMVDFLPAVHGQKMSLTF